MAEETDTFPTELQDRLTAFDEALSQFEDVVKPLHSIPLNEVQSEVLSTIILLYIQPFKLLLLYYRS